MSRRRPHVYSFNALMDRLGSGVWCVMEINDDYVFVTIKHRDYGRPK